MRGWFFLLFSSSDNDRSIRFSALLSKLASLSNLDESEISIDERKNYPPDLRRNPESSKPFPASHLSPCRSQPSTRRSSVLFSRRSSSFQRRTIDATPGCPRRRRSLSPPPASAPSSSPSTPHPTPLNPLAPDTPPPTPAFKSPDFLFGFDEGPPAVKVKDSSPEQPLLLRVSRWSSRQGPISGRKTRGRWSSVVRLRPPPPPSSSTSDAPFPPSSSNLSPTTAANGERMGRS